MSAELQRQRDRLVNERHWKEREAATKEESLVQTLTKLAEIRVRIALLDEAAKLTGTELVDDASYSGIE
jgi:hypothetical protein